MMSHTYARKSLGTSLVRRYLPALALPPSFPAHPNAPTSTCIVLYHFAQVFQGPPIPPPQAHSCAGKWTRRHSRGARETGTGGGGEWRILGESAPRLGGGARMRCDGEERREGRVNQQTKGQSSILHTFDSWSLYYSVIILSALFPPAASHSPSPLSS